MALPPVRQDGAEGSDCDCRYKPIFDAFVDPVMVIEQAEDGRFRIVTMNAAAERRRGMPQEEARGKSPEDLLPAPLAKIVSEQGRRCVETRKTVRFQLTFDEPGGPRVDEVTFSPMFDDGGNVRQILTTSHDVTEHVATRRQLSDTVARMHTFIDNLPDPAWIKDVDSRYLAVNPAFVRYVHAEEAAHIVGKLDLDFLPEAVARSNLVYDLQVIAGGSQLRTEDAVTDLEGRDQRFEVIRSPLVDGNGDIVGTVGIARDITERVRLQSLAEMRERAFRSLANSMPGNIVRYTLDARINYINPQLERFLGMPVAEAAGKTPNELFPGGAYADVERKVRATGRDGRDRELEIPLPQSDGSVNWQHIRVVGERDDEGRLTGVLALGFDITERKRHEEVLLQRAKLQEQLSLVAQAVPGFLFAIRLEPDGHTHFPFVSAGVEELFGLRFEDIRDDADVLRARYHPEDLQRGLARFLESGRTLAPHRAELRILHPEKGVRWVEVRATPARLPDGAVEWHGLMIDITDRKRLEEELVTRERQFRSLAENSPDPIYRFDRDLRRVYVNPVVARLTGTPLNELIGSSPADGKIAGMDSVGKRLEALRAVFADGQPRTIELEYHLHDGSARDYQMMLVPERDTNWEVATVLCIAHDITEQKRHAAMLMEQAKLQERQAAVADAVPGFLFSIRVDTNGHTSFPFASKGIEELAGLRPEDVRTDAAPLRARYHPEDFPRMLALMEETQKTLAPFREEIRILHPEHGERWVDVRSTPQRQADGSTEWHGLMIDITERKRMEAMLAARENRFRSLAENSLDPIFRLDRDGCRLYVNPVVSKITGVPLDRLLGSTQANCRIATPESAERGLGTLRATFDDGQSRSLEVQYLTADGSTRDYHMHMIPERDANGEVATVLAVAHDVTAIREAERRIARFAASTPGYFFSFVRAVDGRRAMPFASTGIRDTLGLEPEDVSQDLDKLYGLTHADDVERVAHLIRESEREQSPLHLEYRILHPVKGERWIECRAQPIREAIGDTVWCGFMHDVTERKSTERELRIVKGALDQSSDVVLLIDENLRFTYANEAACRVFGRSREELATMSPWDIDPNTTREAVWGNFQRQLENREGLVFEARHCDQNGRTFPVEITASIFEHDGASFGLTFSRDITERKRMEEELRQREQYLRTLLDNFPFFVWLKDKDSRLLAANKEYARVANVASTVDLEGKTDFDFFPADLAAKYVEDDRAVMASGEQKGVEEPYVDDDGQRRWMETWKAPIVVDGEVVGTVGFSRDITERREAAEKLRQAHEFTERLINAIPDPVVVKDRQHRWLLLNDACCAMLGHRREELIGKSDRDVLPKEQADVFWEKDEIVFSSRRELVNEEFITDASGALRCLQTKKAVVEGADGDILIAVIRDITERKSMEESLRSNEEKLRRMYSLSPLGIALADKAGRFVEFNEAFRGITGYTADELKTLDYWALTPAEYDEQQIKQLEAFARTGRYGPYEKEYRRKDGTRVAVRINGVRLVGDDGEDHIWAIVEDVTAKRQMERALAQREQEFRSLAENTPDPIFRYDRDCRCIYVNRVVSQRTGVPVEQFLGQRPAERSLLVPADAVRAQASITRVIETGEPEELEVMRIRPDGTEVWYHNTCVPEFGADGKVETVLVIARDATLRRKLEAELLRRTELQEQIASVAEAVPGFLFTTRTDPEGVGSFPYASQGIEDLLGLRPEDIRTDTSLLRACYHPDDLPEFAAASQESLRTLAPFCQEIRMKHPTRGYRWIEVRATPRRLEDGRIEAHGLMIDITERKHAEEALQDSLRFVNELIEAIPGPVFYKDAEGIYLGCNAAFERLMGKPRDVLIGKDVFALWPRDLAERYYTKDNELLENPGSQIYEAQLDGIDGYRDVVFHKATFTRSDGSIGGLVGVVLDITDRRRMEVLIDQERSTLRTFFHALPDLAWMKDMDGRYLACNQAFESFFGASEAEIVGSTDFDFVDAELAAFFRRKDQEAAAAGRPTSNDEWVTFACDGRRVLLETTKAPVFDAHGNVVGILGVAHDVTERKRAEEAIAASELKFRESSDLLHAVLESSPEVMAFALDRDYRYLAFNARHRETMKLLWGRDVAVGINMLDVIGDHPDREIAKRGFDRAFAGESFVTEEAYGDEALTRMYWRNFWSPIRNDAGEIVGMTCFVLNITDRRRMEQDLAAREREFRSLADNLPDNVARWDGQGRYLYVNPTHERTLGMSAADVLGRDVPPSHERVVAALNHVIATGESIATVRQSVPDENGEIRLHDVSIVPEFDGEGRVVSVLGIGRDMTETYRMQDMLAAREQEFRSLAENSPDIIVRYDRECRRTYANQAHAQYTGVESVEIVGKTPMQITTAATASDGGSSHEARLRAVLASREPDEWELSFRRPDGIPVTVSARAVPEFDGQGNIAGVLLIARDVTARRAMEDRLRMAASVFETTSEGIVITDPAGTILDVNPAFMLITGYSREEVLGRNPRMLSAGREESGFYASMWRALTEEGAWSGEIVNRRKDGEIYTERLSVAAVRDAAGTLLHYVGVFSDITLVKEHEARLQHIAHHDTLTGLPNRALLVDRMEQGIAHAARFGKGLATAFLDLDGFKPINDKHGHEVGDRVLVEIAARLKNALRACDTVARLGGDEFVVLLTDQCAAAECERTVERLIAAIAEPIEIGDMNFSLSASVGVSLYPEDGDDPDTLMRSADLAMYTAKRSGRNRYVFYGHDVRERSLEQSDMIHDLREAIEAGQIVAYYQPIIDLGTGQIVKAEALARWNHPERGMVSPSEFIPMAEDAGLIHAIGDRIFREAALVADKWNRACPVAQGQPLRRISVNRSPRQFFVRHDGLDWNACLAGLGLPGEMLGVEITEGLLLDDRPDVQAQLDAMRAAGMKVSLDDFGTGYSALSYLKKFDIDYLKIDRSFVRDILTDESDRTIVESVIAMAKRLGIMVVAEGVETEAQAQLLAAAGCEYAQGFLFAVPMAESEFLAFVQSIGSKVSLGFTSSNVGSALPCAFGVA